ncbi:MAG: NUDIX domain-containing protein [Propionibacteriaceae bacterium]
MRATNTYRDRSGKTLEDYPRPSVAVDTAALTVHDGRLCVLLIRDESGDERLPGTFLHADETLRDAALRALREKAGIQGLNPRQLQVFDDPKRDDRGWVLSVAHLDAVRVDQIPLTEQTRLMPVDQLPPLAYDHAAIVGHATAQLRAEYQRMPDPWHLLPPDPDGLAIRDLRLLHEAVLRERLIADTFRRAMLPGLEPTGQIRRGMRGKPAELFRRRAD